MLRQLHTCAAVCTCLPITSPSTYSQLFVTQRRLASHHLPVTACNVLIATPALLIEAQALRHLMVPFFGTSELGKAAFIGTCIIDGRCIARLVLVQVLSAELPLSCRY